LTGWAGAAGVRWIKDAVIRAATEGTTPECRPLELDVFVQELEAHTPVRVDPGLPNDASTVRPVRQSRESNRGDPGLERDPYRDEGGEG
jgi:hypothetical protein